MQVSIAERFLLLALDPVRGVVAGGRRVDAALSGALLGDLHGQGRLVETGDGVQMRNGTGGAPEDPLVAATAEVIADSPRTRAARAWVRCLPRHLSPLRDRVARSLESKRVLAARSDRRLGVISRTRWVEVDPEPGRLVRERLQAVLLTEAQASDADAFTLGLLASCGMIRPLVPRDRRAEANARARMFCDAWAATRAVARSVGGREVALPAPTP